MDSSESIRFDEYMEGGIPPHLLQGLGYSEAGRLEVDENSSDDAEGSCDEDNVHTLTGEAQMDIDSVKSSLKMSMAQTAQSQARSAAATQAFQSRRSRSGRIAQKRIIKGNIIYERTETGEVVASIIKGGDEIPSPSPSVVQATPKHRPRKQMQNQVELELPWNCPITEDNIDFVLDESIRETNSMRQHLMTLKDDLRRMGGGPHVTAQLKPVHMKRREEIAKQVTRVFLDYLDACDKICDVNRAFTNEACSPLEAVPTPEISASLPSVETSLPKKLTKNMRQGAKRQPHAVSPTGLEEPPAVTPSSDDLFMSCEPGSDDEMGNRMARSQKRKKTSNR